MWDYSSLFLLKPECSNKFIVCAISIHHDKNANKLMTYKNYITDAQSKNSHTLQEVSPAKITRVLRDVLSKSCCVINIDRKHRK